MPVIVIKDEKNLAQLRDRVLKSNVSRANVEEAEKVLRKANPGLDLDALRPGDVLLVPDEVAGARKRIGDVAGPALASAEDPVTEQLAGLVAAAAAGEKDAAARTAATAAALGDPRLQEQARADDQLRAGLDAAAEHIEAERAAAEARAEALRAATEAWAEDLAALTRRSRR